MVVSSFSTADTICSLIVSASAWLFASAVRHHSTWTPIALTMIDARTRPEIARRMRIRMIIGASYCMYRKCAIDAKQMASLPAMLALAKIGQLPTTRHSGRFDLTFPSGHVDDMRYPRVRRLTRTHATCSTASIESKVDDECSACSKHSRRQRRYHRRARFVACRAPPAG